MKTDRISRHGWIFAAGGLLLAGFVLSLTPDTVAQTEKTDKKADKKTDKKAKDKTETAKAKKEKVKAWIKDKKEKIKAWGKKKFDKVKAKLKSALGIKDKDKRTRRQRRSLSIPRPS